MPVVLGAYSPRCLGFGLDAPYSPVGALGRRPGGEEIGAAAAGEFPKVPPEDLFLCEKILLLNPAAPLYKEGPVLLHSPPLQLDRDCPGQGPTRPNSQLSPGGAHGLCGFAISSLFPYPGLQATTSLLVLL